MTSLSSKPSKKEPKVSKVAERFIKYARIHTTSSENSDKTPSTERQFNLANILVDELNEMGIEASVDENCIVLGRIPSNLSDKEEKNTPTIAFIAHMDTSPSAPGNNVKPVVTEYKGGDIKLNSEHNDSEHNDSEHDDSEHNDSANFTLKLSENPQLEQFIGDYIITSDGTTLIGADDKAGIAEIMQAAEEIIMIERSDNPDVPKFKHGEIVIIFTPDEEVGRGTENLDLNKVKADFAYTIDGSGVGELEIENFNAINGDVHFIGYDVHPGYAYGKMKNSIRALREFLNLFPDDEAPETTRDMQGYYHFHAVKGTPERSECSFILRDFNSKQLELKRKRLEEGIEKIKKKYPGIGVDLTIKRVYNNMREVLEKTPKVIDLAKKAIEKEGIKVIEKPIRGGTDGANLSFRGLPTPNIFSGGYNFHSKSEWIPVSSMEKAVRVIKNIISLAVDSKNN